MDVGSAYAVPYNHDHDIELMDKLVTKLPEIEAESQLPSNLEKIFPLERLEGSALRALRHFWKNKTHSKNGVV